MRYSTVSYTRFWWVKLPNNIVYRQAHTHKIEGTKKEEEVDERMKDELLFPPQV
jgi:hypothetical protein